jgi:hypothetical protein
VHPRIVIDIAKRIRRFLIEISKQTASSKGRQSKQSQLYEYFTSSEYYRGVSETIDAKDKLDGLQRKEEEYHKTLWNRRKELIEKWFEIDKKNEETVSDISQDQPFNETEDESKDDKFDSFS